jgi:vanillate O-demethylase ferredoxin subunit
MKNKLLRRLRILHRWTGPTAGLVLAVVAISGAGLALRPRLEPVLSAGLMQAAPCAAPLPLDALAARARAAAPEAGPLVALRLSGASGASVHVRFSDERWIYVAPCSGAVLGSEHRYKGLFGTLDALHRFKYLPNSALVAGSLAATFALVLLLGGLLVWRPSRRAAQHALSLHPRLPPRAFSISLHKTLALYAGPILLVSALSGVVQAFDWPKEALLALTGSDHVAAAPAPLPVRTVPHPGLQQVWQLAHQFVPDIGHALIMLPKRPADPIRLELVAADAPHAEAHGELAIDPASGAVLRWVAYEDAAPGKRFLMWLFALHTGQLGGVGVQLLLILAALSVPLLAFAGWRSYQLGRVVRSGSV